MSILDKFSTLLKCFAKKFLWFISSHECWSILCGFFALICLLHICCISFAIFCLRANPQCIDTGIIFLWRYFQSVTFQRQWTWQAKLEIVIWFISQLFTDLVWCIGLRLKWNDPILKYVSLIAQFHGYISGRGSSFKMVEACKVISHKGLCPYEAVHWGLGLRNRWFEAAMGFGRTITSSLCSMPDVTAGPAATARCTQCCTITYFDPV